MRVWRVILGATDVVPQPGEPPIPAIQHVAFVAARSADRIPQVLASDPDLGPSMRDHIPQVMEELPTDLPLWTAKIGPHPNAATLFSCVPAPTREMVRDILIARVAESEELVAWIRNEWFAVNPRPIDLSMEGVW